MTEFENPTINRIVNTDIVRQHFGYWPSFHDAEIAKVTLEANPGYWPSATFVIKAFETTKEVTENGFFKTVKHCAIEFQFTGIQEIELDYFSHQNVLFDLALEESDNAVKCIFNSSVGLEAVVVASEARVLSLTPITS